MANCLENNSPDPTPVHPFGGLPDRLRLLAHALVERPLLDLPDRPDVEEQVRPKSDDPLVGHHLEEVQVPAALALVAPPDQ
jgi:hypothetical protein